MFVLQTLLPIFAQTILPVFLVAAAGFLLANGSQSIAAPWAACSFFLATPSLVFRSLYRSELDFVMLQHLAIVAATVALLSGFLGWLTTAGESRQRRAALILSSAISNNGNMGIPISYFAFGEIGLALGSIYYVVVSFFSNTFGVVIASAGRTAVRQAFVQSVRVPVLYAATVGLLLNMRQITIPQPMFRAVDLLADAAIPGMLVLLGVQLHKAPWAQLPPVLFRSALIRLLLGPLLAGLLCWLLSVPAPERSVLILQAGMPTAVMAAVLATEYETEPSLVATAILISTLLSMVTLSLLLWFVM